jgi:hypothetical protein
MEVFETRLAASAASAEIIAEGLQSLNRRSHPVCIRLDSDPGAQLKFARDRRIAEGERARQFCQVMRGLEESRNAARRSASSPAALRTQPGGLENGSTTMSIVLFLTS